MKLLSRITAIATGGITTVVLISVSEISLLISLLAGVATTGATLLAIPTSGKKKKINPPKIRNPKKITSQIAGETDLKSLKSIVLQVPRGEARDVLNRVVKLSDQLVHATEKDPRDEPQLRSFFNHYLPSTIKIVKCYLDISQQQKNKTDEIKATLAKTEQSLYTIENAFKNQLTKLLDNDILDLDVEVKVLEQSLRLDGLVDKNSDEKGHA